MLKSMAALFYMLMDRTLGALWGQRCDLCREWTTRRLSDRHGTLTWCLVCTASELRRHGL